MTDLSDPQVVGVDFVVDDGVATITLKRPESGNAISPGVHRRLRQVWEQVRDDDDIRVAIITGAGDRHFCTGADLKAAAERGSIGDGERPFSEEVRLSPRQNRVWKPVICAVNGLVVGGGLHFVVDADIVVASSHAEFMDAHVNVGQVGGLENIGLAKRLPLGTALQMTLLGRNFRLPADRAYQLGLVDRLVDHVELMPACLEMADQIKQCSPRALSLSQQAMWKSLEMGYADSLEYAWSLIRLHRHHPDAVEGPTAFAQRRAPKWTP